MLKNKKVFRSMSVGFLAALMTASAGVSATNIQASQQLGVNYCYTETQPSTRDISDVVWSTENSPTIRGASVAVECNRGDMTRPDEFSTRDLSNLQDTQELISARSVATNPTRLAHEFNFTFRAQWDDAGFGFQTTQSFSRIAVSVAWGGHDNFYAAYLYRINPNNTLTRLQRLPLNSVGQHDGAAFIATNSGMAAFEPGLYAIFVQNTRFVRVAPALIGINPINNINIQAANENIMDYVQQGRTRSISYQNATIRQRTGAPTNMRYSVDSDQVQSVRSRLTGEQFLIMHRNSSQIMFSTRAEADREASIIRGLRDQWQIFGANPVTRFTTTAPLR